MHAILNSGPAIVFAFLVTQLVKNNTLPVIQYRLTELYFNSKAKLLIKPWLLIGCGKKLKIMRRFLAILCGNMR